MLLQADMFRLAEQEIIFLKTVITEPIPDPSSSFAAVNSAINVLDKGYENCHRQLFHETVEEHIKNGFIF